MLRGVKVLFARRRELRAEWRLVGWLRNSTKFRRPPPSHPPAGS